MSRVLLIVHGHPELSRGGGERAAELEAEQLRALGHQVLMIARVAGPSGRGGTPFTMRGQDVLFHAPSYDYFLHSQRAKWAIWRDLRALIERFQPDVAHLHHYVHIGLETIRELRKYSASLPIVLTLHEYLAICHSNGQFLTPDGTLCHQASPSDCAACFPDHSRQDFFLRERFIKSAFALVDRFICPSRFLLERYAAWGVAREKLVLLENGQVPLAVAPPAARDADLLCRRFAFFGQATELKGIKLLLRAAELLPAALRAEGRLDIAGTVTHQSAEFVADFRAMVAALGGFAQYHGPYRPDELPGLMARAGWVVVPSLWWENSPIVIQEAFAARRPVICADIGGMAEKVANGRAGLHFRVNDARDLASVMERAADPALWLRLANGTTPPPAIGQTVDALLGLFDTIRAEHQPQTKPRARAARARRAD